MAFKNYREESRKQWGQDQETSLNIEQITIGALLRIADATEAMAKNHVKLQEDYDRMKQSRDYNREKVQQLENSLRTMKGVVTKLKKRIPKSCEWQS